LFLLL